MKSVSDPRILGAILNAPPFLSGLNDTEFNLIRQRARTALHPEQSQMQEKLKKALAELQEGSAATKRMVLERCELREDEQLVRRS
jgi:phage I-like protein